MHPAGGAWLTALYIFVGILGGSVVISGGCYGFVRHIKRRYGHPWHFVIGQAGDPETGTPKQVGLIEAVFGNPANPEQSPGLLNDVAYIKTQVSPNGANTQQLGDIALRVERKVEELDDKLNKHIAYTRRKFRELGSR